MEGVLDSSRYFVLKIVNDSGEWFSVRVLMVKKLFQINYIPLIN